MCLNVQIDLHLTLNFLINHSNNNASYHICCFRSNPKDSRFENIICKLSQYFDEIVLYNEPTNTSVSGLNFIIYLKRFKYNSAIKNKINFFDKEDYICDKSIEIKNNINEFINKLLIENINFYTYLKSFDFFTSLKLV